MSSTYQFPVFVIDLKGSAFAVLTPQGIVTPILFPILSFNPNPIWWQVLTFYWLILCSLLCKLRLTFKHSVSSWGTAAMHMKTILLNRYWLLSIVLTGVWSLRVLRTHFLSNFLCVQTHKVMTSYARWNKAEKCVMK